MITFEVIMLNINKIYYCIREKDILSNFMV